MWYIDKFVDQPEHDFFVELWSSVWGFWGFSVASNSQYYCFYNIFYDNYISLLGHPFPNESTKDRNRLNIALHFYIN